jgi:drug/metabolite transporter (DMT)-like permease
MTATKNHQLGVLLAGAAALCWSMSGIFTRGISADLMPMLFWRGLFSGSAVMLIYFVIEGRNALAGFRKLGWPALAVALLSAMSMITGIGALRFGAAADVMVIYATAPFLTAGLAWLFFRERTSNATIMASLAALVGVVIMLWGNDFGGAPTGIILACFMTLGMAGFSILLRHYRDVPMLPAMAASGWIVSIICFFASQSLSVSTQDFAFIAAFGVVQNAAGLALYTLGSRKIPAAEAALLASLEVPLTPLWVWMIFNEAPTRATLLGGSIVLVALATHIIGEWRRPKEDLPPLPAI